jgi:hypothetical protein
LRIAGVPWTGQQELAAAKLRAEEEKARKKAEAAERRK